MKLTTQLLFALALTAETAFLSVSASDSAPAHDDNHGLVRRFKTGKRMTVPDVAKREVQDRSEMEKRDSHTGIATWYGVEHSLGACGGQAHNADHTVALNIDLYGDQNAVSSWCGKELVITSGDVTQTAVVGDCCPTCPGNGDLDMSTGLFSLFNPLALGVFPITWHVAGDGDDTSTSSTPSSTPLLSAVTSLVPLSTVTPAVVAPQSTYTIFSTVTAPSTMAAIVPLNATTPAASSVVANATVTTPAVLPAAAAKSSEAATPSEPAQNLAGMSELLKGMFDLANAGQA